MQKLLGCATKLEINSQLSDMNEEWGVKIAPKHE
jgi:hypothetical protein